MKMSFLRGAKLLFSRWRLHVLVNPLASGLQNLVYMSKLSAWIHQHKRIPYNDYPSKWDYTKRYPMYEWVLKKENLSTGPIQYLEFGVASGESFKWFLSKNNHPQSSFHGFDTFTGLPEDFGSYKKGTFGSNNEVPQVSDPRAAFYQGLFQQTLPGFVSRLDPSLRKLIMIDADLYSSTLFVLTTLAPFLQKNDIIFFDEFAVPKHEFRAFIDFTSSYYQNLELIAAANNFYFVAFRVG
jgi:O-methyltransferase